MRTTGIFVYVYCVNLLLVASTVLVSVDGLFSSPQIISTSADVRCAYFTKVPGDTTTEMQDEFSIKDVPVVYYYIECKQS